MQTIKTLVIFIQISYNYERFRQGDFPQDNRCRDEI